MLFGRLDLMVEPEKQNVSMHREFESPTWCEGLDFRCLCAVESRAPRRAPESIRLNADRGPRG